MKAQADTAVALQYSDDLPAPIVLASGRGPLAEAIMRIARESGVTIVADPDLAASLIQLDVNTLIPESLYGVIAEILVFVRNVRIQE
jgi:flagellar biosynthesis protein